MHPPAHRVLGFICKPGLLGRKRYAFNLKQLSTIGPESIVVNSQPAETDTEKVKVLETLIGNEVWSDGGERVGRIIDCLFNGKSGLITDYLFKSEGWRGLAGGIYLLPPTQILGFGPQRVFVPAGIAQRCAAYQEGLDLKFAKVGDRLKGSYSEVTEDLRSLTEQAQDVTQQAKGQLQQLTEKTAQQVQTLAEQAAQQAKTVRQQLDQEAEARLPEKPIPEAVPELWAQFQEKAQDFGEDLKEELLPLAERWKRRLNTHPRPQSHRPVSDSPLDLEDIPPEDLADDEPWID